MPHERPNEEVALAGQDRSWTPEGAMSYALSLEDDAYRGSREILDSQRYDPDGADLLASELRTYEAARDFRPTGDWPSDARALLTAIGEETRRTNGFSLAEADEIGAYEQLLYLRAVCLKIKLKTAMGVPDGVLDDEREAVHREHHDIALHRLVIPAATVRAIDSVLERWQPQLPDKREMYESHGDRCRQLADRVQKACVGWSERIIALERVLSAAEWAALRKSLDAKDDKLAPLRESLSQFMSNKDLAEARTQAADMLRETSLPYSDEPMEGISVRWLRKAEKILANASVAFDAISERVDGELLDLERAIREIDTAS